ncbi:MAG: RNA polymerase sigma factor [Myxococcota bacterium]
MPTDHELLAAWASGDEQAGKAVFERHYSSVYRFFRAKGLSEMEDLVQETFLAVVRGHASFRGDASFRAFLFGTARNTLRQHYRRRQRKEGRLDFGSHSAVDLGASPSAVVADKAEKRLLLEGLRRLPIDDQIVLELFLWESLTAKELGAVLELTEAAVRSRLHRAKNRLRVIMEEIGESAEVLESTLADLDGWAKNVRDELEHGAK